MPVPKAAGAAIRSRSLVPGHHTSTATRFCGVDAVPGPATTVDGRTGARRRRQHVPRGLPLDGGVSGAWLRCGTRTSASGSGSPYSAGFTWAATRNGAFVAHDPLRQEISTSVGWFVVSGAHARQLQRLIDGRERGRVYGYLRGVPRASSCEKNQPARAIIGRATVRPVPTGSWREGSLRVIAGHAGGNIRGNCAGGPRARCMGATEAR